MAPVKVYSAFDVPPNPGIDFSKEKMITRQSERDACDINKIVAQFDKTGLLPQVGAEALYMDVSQVGDYRAALQAVETADGFFSQLPASVRAKFDNDPAAFLDFCSDPGNREQMVELGLIEAPAAAPGVPGAPAVPSTQ